VLHLVDRFVESQIWNPSFVAMGSDFCPDAKKQSNAQVWIRLSDLPREYWREKTLIEIACVVGMPITLGERTRHRIFGHYSRLLVDVNLSKPLHDNILVEREGFAFHVGVAYEKHREYCTPFSSRVLVYVPPLFCTFYFYLSISRCCS